MAIYHLSVKTISRSAGRTATGAAAYRAGVRIRDERTGELFDYRKRKGVLHAEIVLPDDAPKWAFDRAQLWNAAEMAETRKNATVAREFEVALPHELSLSAQKALAIAFAREIVQLHGCAADVCIHAPNSKGDARNVHAHILLTTRILDSDGFGSKTREFDDRKSGPRLIEIWRERWADLANRYLKQHGIDERIDHRSLRDQGILDREPMRHLGPAAIGYERRTGQKSRRRLDIEEEIAERLAAAKELGELERQQRTVERTIIDLSTDIEAAKRERDRLKRVQQQKGQEARRSDTAPQQPPGPLPEDPNVPEEDGPDFGF